MTDEPKISTDRSDGLTFDSRANQCIFRDIDATIQPNELKLHIYQLSDDGKKRVLALRPRSDVIVEADVLLARLASLSPTAAAAFAPKPKDLTGLVFRLVGGGGGRMNPAGGPESFIALSYCWGGSASVRNISFITDASDPTAAKLCILPTSPAMFQAILAERRSDDEGLWYDQACIEQDDEEEKAVSVAAMDVVYSSARLVVVALEDIEVEPEEAVFLREYVKGYEKSNDDKTYNLYQTPPFLDRHTVLRDLLVKIVTSRWFERAWCGHEMRLSQSRVFLIPCKATSGNPDHRAVLRFSGVFFHHLLALFSESQSPDPALQFRKTNLIAIVGQQVLKENNTEHDDVTWQLRRPVLTDIAQEVFRSKAGGNPRLPEALRAVDACRDKVSIILNTAGLPLALKPRLTVDGAAPPVDQFPATADEHMYQVQLVALAKGCPLVFCAGGGPLEVADAKPSWACWPTPFDHTPAHVAPSRVEVCDDRWFDRLCLDPASEFVELDLLIPAAFPDNPRAVTPRDVCGPTKECARSFIDRCIEKGVRSDVAMWNWWQTSEIDTVAAYTKAFAELLACCLACGAAWIEEVSHVIQLVGRSNFVVTQEALNGLFDLEHGRLKEEVALEARAAGALLTYLGVIISYGIPWHSGHSVRTCRPCVVHSTSGHAVLFAPPKACKVAVPMVLRDQRYSHVARYWFLEHKAESGKDDCWKLVGKAKAFANGAFEEALSNRQAEQVRWRVYGPSKNVDG